MRIYGTFMVIYGHGHSNENFEMLSTHVTAEVEHDYLPSCFSCKTIVLESLWEGWL
jgi:hypothetical protein